MHSKSPSVMAFCPYVSGFCHIHGKTPRGILPVNSCPPSNIFSFCNCSVPSQLRVKIHSRSPSGTAVLHDQQFHTQHILKPACLHCFLRFCEIHLCLLKFLSTVCPCTGQQVSCHKRLHSQFRCDFTLCRTFSCHFLRQHHLPELL